MTHTLTDEQLAELVELMADADKVGGDCAVKLRPPDPEDLVEERA